MTDKELKRKLAIYGAVGIALILVCVGVWLTGSYLIITYGP